MSDVQQRRRRIVGDVTQRFGTVLAARLDLALGDKGPSVPADALRRFRRMVVETAEGGGGTVAAGSDDDESVIISFHQDRHARVAAKVAVALRRGLRDYVRGLDGKAEWSIAMATGPYITRGRGKEAHIIGEPVDAADDLLDPRIGLCAAKTTFEELGELRESFREVEDEEPPCYRYAGL